MSSEFEPFLPRKKVRKQAIKETPFQVWKLVKDGDKATITIEDGNDNLVKAFTLTYTSFPLKTYTLWMIEGVLLLKSEY